MCQYRVSDKELYDRMTDALDNIEGDFTKEQLLKALKRLQKYPNVLKIVKTKEV